MKDKKTKDQRHIISWNQFISRGLAVTPDLMGARHKFEFDGHVVEIVIPDISSVKEGKERFEHGVKATTGSRWASDNKVIEYYIHRVDVILNQNQELLIDPETFNQNPVAYDLYTEDERNHFEKVCGTHKRLATTYYEYWLSVLRWKLDDFRIGRFEISGNDSSWSTYLKDSENGKTVWIQTGIFTILGQKTVDSDNWNDIQRSLTRNETPPSYISLKHDAEESMSHKDYVKAIIELAMSCEIFLRNMVLQGLSNNIPSNIMSAIEELNITQYVNKHFKVLVPKKKLTEYNKLAKELTSLFNKRNSILHMGNSEGATLDNCQRYLKLSKTLHDFSSILEYS